MIQLQRQVEVFTFDAEATVSVGKDRPEFLAVARLAKDFQRPIDGRIVARELLGGLPEQVGWRVIDRCVALGLLQREAQRGPVTLSGYGENALLTGKVLVPEEGIWRFYMVDDVLLEDSLIHVERLDSANAKEERDAIFTAKKSGQPRASQGQATPKYLSECVSEGLIFSSVVHHREFAIEQVGPRGEHGPDDGLWLAIEWGQGQRPKLALRGQVMSPPRAERPDPQRQDKHARPEKPKAKPLAVDHSLDEPQACTGTEYEQIWQYLAAAGLNIPVTEISGWHNKARELVAPISFTSKLPNPARNTMQMTLPIPESEIPGLGSFESTKLDGVKLVPRTPDDAQAWAEWLQWQAINKYATPTWLEALGQQVLKRFPHHRPKLPNSSALLERALKQPGETTARYLLAPYDLGLWS